MKLELAIGDHITVSVAGTKYTFTVTASPTCVRVEASHADSYCRNGVLFCAEDLDHSVFDQAKITALFSLFVAHAKDSTKLMGTNTEPTLNLKHRFYEDYGMDSLDVVELKMAVEDAFSIKGLSENIYTVEDLLTEVTSMLNVQPAVNTARDLSAT